MYIFPILLTFLSLNSLSLLYKINCLHLLFLEKPIFLNSFDFLWSFYSVLLFLRHFFFFSFSSVTESREGGCLMAFDTFIKSCVQFLNGKTHFTLHQSISTYSCLLRKKYLLIKCRCTFLSLQPFFFADCNRKRY